MRKCCDLCGCSQARVHCESDQASLCWACDLKVHAANFLVEKHVRVLLCGSCSAQTPWKASGACLGSAATLCEVCFRVDGVGVLCGEEGRAGVDRDEHGEGQDDEEGVEDDVEDEDVEELDDEEDGENQVVPWAFDSPPPVDISTSTGEIGDDFGDACESRMDGTHQIVHPDLEERELCHSYASSAPNAWVAASSNPSLYRPAKRQRRIDEPTRNGQHLCNDGEEEGPSLAKLLQAFPTAATVGRPG